MLLTRLVTLDIFLSKVTRSIKGLEWLFPCWAASTASTTYLRAPIVDFPGQNNNNHNNRHSFRITSRWLSCWQLHLQLLYCLRPSRRCCVSFTCASFRLESYFLQCSLLLLALCGFRGINVVPPSVYSGRTYVLRRLHFHLSHKGRYTYCTSSFCASTLLPQGFYAFLWCISFVVWDSFALVCQLSRSTSTLLFYCRLALLFSALPCCALGLWHSLFGLLPSWLLHQADVYLLARLYQLWVLKYLTCLHSTYRCFLP